jgi:hypothetical protein
MSDRAARWVLWTAALAALPVPILVLGPGHVPPAQIAELGAAAFVFGLAETFRGVAGWTAAIFLGQAALYALALWLGAGAVVRRLGARRGWAVAAAVALLAVAWLVPIYHTPYHATLSHATLAEVYR